MHHVKALNAINGTTKAPLLFYEICVGYITSVGFKLNPYVQCVANKLINCKQVTAVWHVGDLKVIHKSKKDCHQNGKMGSGKMKISIGKIHEFLVMTFDFSKALEVKINMIPYIEEIVKDFTNHDDTINTSATPESDHLLIT